MAGARHSAGKLGLLVGLPLAGVWGAGHSGNRSILLAWVGAAALTPGASGKSCFAFKLREAREAAAT
jgi:hypothetical protein